MTDGQTFMAFMAVFYLWGCFRSAAWDSNALRMGWWQRYRFYEPVTRLAGIKKAVFFAPVLPWPRALIVADLAGQHRGSVASNLRLLKLGFSVTSDLRFSGLILTLMFFCALPWAYTHYGDSLEVLICAASCWALMWMIGLRYFFLHRRLAVEALGERAQNLFFAVTMPWHAMRLADALLQGHSFSKVHPLVLAQLCTRGEGKKFIQQEYRNTRYNRNPRFSEAEFQSLLIAPGFFDPNELPRPQAQGAECQKFCPCCLSAFTKKANTCSECDDLELVEF